MNLLHVGDWASPIASDTNLVLPMPHIVRHQPAGAMVRVSARTCRLEDEHDNPGARPLPAASAKTTPSHDKPQPIPLGRDLRETPASPDYDLQGESSWGGLLVPGPHLDAGGTVHAPLWALRA